MDREEIKEILELYKNNDIEYYNLVSDLGYDKLLNYITKLQYYYNDNINDYEKLIVKYSNLQERINKTIEFIQNHIVATETEEVILQILKGENNG